jgi:hypothetical protein
MKFTKKLLKHKYKLNTKVVISIFVFISLFNIASIISSVFANWYRKNIFRKISNILPRITASVQISVGEVMICLFIVFVILGVIITIMGFLQSALLKKIRKIYYRVMVYILLFIYWTETFHCFIMYRTNTIEQDNYVIIAEKISERNNEENMGDLVKICNYIIDELNELALILPRNESGDLMAVYSYEDCIKAMRNISSEYPLLNGYYPEPKKIYYSNIMSQQYMAGIYFPFSMEANYNKFMYSSNVPSVICHELSHLKGYIREDEANFISFVACINSDNDFIKYSGYLDVYNYIVRDIFNYGSDEMIEKVTSINELVDYDNIFLKEEIFDEIEENAIISTDTLSEATNKFLDSNLKINGVSSGINNYNEIVKLVMYYYNTHGLVD